MIEHARNQLEVHAGRSGVYVLRFILQNAKSSEMKQHFDVMPRRC